MKKINNVVLRCMAFCLLLTASCGNTSTAEEPPKIDPPLEEPDPEPKPPVVQPNIELAKQNMVRAMELADAAVECYFDESAGMLMARFYNPFTKEQSQWGGSEASIWKYTSAIESVNAVMRGLRAHSRSGDATLYDLNFGRYKELLGKLHQNRTYYRGSYTLTSYTQAKKWSVYAVPRGNRPDEAKPGGGTFSPDLTQNVYDDQMWLIRELIEAYRLTDDQAYLTEAEYLTDYVLDGWDCTLDASGNENGGIPWGPGYVTKHACSNGPMISPLVWLHEMYRDKGDEVSYGYIGEGKARLKRTVKKSDYYLDFAEKIYNWQKSRLLRADGVYHDMMGGCNPCTIQYETVDRVKYRANTPLSTSTGTAHSYNCGSMLSGAVDLYYATAKSGYLDDIKKLTTDSFNYFAKRDQTVPGYYTYTTGEFADWFNGVLFRAYVEAYPIFNKSSVCIDTFQKNLDHGYTNFLHDGFLPHDLLAGWKSNEADNKEECMTPFTFAAEYAILSTYELEKDK